MHCIVGTKKAVNRYIIVATVLLLVASSILLPAADAKSVVVLEAKVNATVAPPDGGGMVADSRGAYALVATSNNMSLEYSNKGYTAFRSVMIVNGSYISDPHLVLTHGHLIALWVQDEPVNELMIATNLTATKFTAPRSITSSNSDIYFEVAAVAQVLYVGYMTGGRITLLVGDDSGSHFASSPVSNPEYRCQEVSLAASGSDMYMVWENRQGDSLPNAYLLSSSDRGSTFIIRQLNANDDAREPIVAVSQNGNVYVVWRDDSKPQEVWITRSVDHGVVFSIPREISNKSMGAREPWVTASGSSVYVTYRESSGESVWNPIMEVSQDNGTKFETVTLRGACALKSINDGSDSPEAAAQGHTIGVMFDCGSKGAQTEWLMVSSNRGDTFSTIKVDDANRTHDQLISAFNGNYYLMWKTRIDSNTSVGLAIVDTQGETELLAQTGDGP